MYLRARARVHPGARSFLRHRRRLPAGLGDTATATKSSTRDKFDAPRHDETPPRCRLTLGSMLMTASLFLMLDSLWGRRSSTSGRP